MQNRRLLFLKKFSTFILILVWKKVGSVDNHFHKMDTPIQAGPTGYTDGFVSDFLLGRSFFG